MNTEPFTQTDARTGIAPVWLLLTFVAWIAMAVFSLATQGGVGL